MKSNLRLNLSTFCHTPMLFHPLVKFNQKKMLENEWLLSEKFYHFRCVSKASSDMLRASVEIQKKPFVCNIQLEVVVTMQTLLHATILPFLLVVVAVCLLHANFYGLLHSMSDDYIFAIASIDNNNRRWITMIKHQTFIQFE